MTSEAPRAFNREMYHDHPENVHVQNFSPMKTMLRTKAVMQVIARIVVHGISWNMVNTPLVIGT